MTIRRRAQLHPGALDRHQRFVVWMRVPGPHHVHPFSKNLHAKKKRKKAEVVSTVPDCKRRSNRLQRGRRSRSHLFGILWNIRLEQFLTVRSRCSTERSQSQERDDHGHRHGCPRGPRTQEGERTAPPTELQRKKNTCLYFVPLSSWVLLKGGGAGLCRDC